MEERARRLGGALALRSAPGAGTTVRLEVGGG
jgi:signal transduction histidine kinase